MSLRQNRSMYAVDSEYKPRRLTRKERIERVKSRYTFEKKTYGDQLANTCLAASCKSKFKDEPLTDNEIAYIRDLPIHLQSDIRRDPGKLMDSYTRQQEERSKGSTKDVKHLESTKKPSEQFISKSEPHKKPKEEIDAELETKEDSEINEILDEKMKHMHKRIKGKEW